MIATSFLVSNTLWSELYIFTPSLYGNAIAHSGSRNACSVKGVSNVSVITYFEFLIAASVSPLLT